MTFSNFSANTIHIVDDVLDYDYQQLWINVLTIGAVCAVILGAMYQQLRLVKFSTPYQFSEWFYLSMNLRRDFDPEEERFGISFGSNYFGIYGNGTAAWGKLDANGCL